VLIVLKWVLVLVALVGLIQAVVWIGQPRAPAGRRLLGVFTAPLALLLLLVALTAVRVPGLWF
jgi:hypothetical protein